MRPRRIYRTPTTVDLEITDICNEKCVYCFNFDRDLSMGSLKLDKEKIDHLVRQFVNFEVFHVISSGGEAFANFEMLLYLNKKLKENNISTSVNSNLSIKAQRKERLKRLFDSGCDHILTSLPSYLPDVTNKLVNSKNAFDRITSGIKDAVEIGFRISANMVVHNSNKNQVYLTAKLASELGCQRIFATRIVGPDYETEVDYENTSDENPNILSKKSALDCLDQLIKARDECGIDVSTIVSYPLCLLGDLQKYADFVGRGCPTQRGHRLNILPNGDIRSCVHLSSERLGNVFRDNIDLSEQYKKLRKWHDGSLAFNECKKCDYKYVCNSGCRVDAKAYSGKLNGKDPLMVGPIINGKIHGRSLRKFVPFKITYDKKTREIVQNSEFIVSKEARFRYEESFYLCSIKYGNIIEIDYDIAKFLIEKQRTNQSFNLKEFGLKNIQIMIDYFCKDLIRSVDNNLNDKRNKNLLKKGLGIDPNNLPDYDKFIFN